MYALLWARSLFLFLLLVTVTLASPITGVGSRVSLSIFYDDFLDNRLDPEHWITGFRNGTNPIQWSQGGGVSVRAEQGEARLTGAPHNNSLLGLSSMDVSGSTVQFRAKYSLVPFSYWLVLSSKPALRLATDYELVLPFDNWEGRGRISKEYQTYTLTVSGDGTWIEFYRECELIGKASLPFARSLYWMGGNEDRILHLDDVRVIPGEHAPICITIRVP